MLLWICAAWSPTPSDSVLIFKKLQILRSVMRKKQQQKHKAKKNTNKNTHTHTQPTKQKATKWLILCMAATIIILRNRKTWGKSRGEIRSSDNTYCCGCDFICTHWEQQFRAIITIVLKMLSMLLLTIVCMLMWLKKWKMCFPTTPYLFLVSVGFASTRVAKVRGEPSNTKLSSLAQHTIQVTALVS